MEEERGQEGQRMESPEGDRALEQRDLKKRAQRAGHVGCRGHTRQG